MINNFLIEFDFVNIFRPEDIDCPLWMFWKRRRYVVACLAFFGFFNVYSLRVNLSIAIVAMTEERQITLDNGTTITVRILLSCA